MSTYSNTSRIVVAPTQADLARARAVIADHLTPTPLVPTTVAGDQAWLKLECLQPTGSFKVRGALAAMSAVPEGGEVLAVSAGNHALGIAWASQRLGVPATVVIAETASPAKRAKLEQLPVELVRHGQSYDEAEQWTIARAQGTGETCVFISAYNDPLVIAGASTVMDEIAAQTDGPLTVVVPASGGGLLAGVALRASELASAERPIRIVGVELETSRAVSAALAAGTPVEVPIEPSIADGLSGNIEPGAVTVDVMAGRVETVVAVSEDEVRSAIRFLATEQGLVAEGAGAAATAALLAGKVDRRGTTVAIVSGRNISLPLLAEVLGQ